MRCIEGNKAAIKHILYLVIDTIEHVTVNKAASFACMSMAVQIEIELLLRSIIIMHLFDGKDNTMYIRNVAIEEYIEVLPELLHEVITSNHNV